MNSHVQSRLADKEAAEAEAARLRAESAALAARLVELKATEAERMNEVNKMCEQMVSSIGIAFLASAREIRLLTPVLGRCKM